MTKSGTTSLISQIREMTILRTSSELSDCQLLKNYVECREEAAFAMIVHRHAPMVWGVCRRVLASWHDAEDAFQATFLILVSKAATIAAPELLANWLYGVAHQTALKARRTSSKRLAKERQVSDVPELKASDRDAWEELQPLLDLELSQLPRKFRAAIVLCDLEGNTRREAANRLGVPEGTLAAWVARGRVLLAKRLAKHRLAISGGALGAILAERASSATVPTLLIRSTIHTANLFARGQASGVISENVTLLTKGVLKNMLTSKLKVPLLAFLVFFAGLGAYLCSGTPVDAHSEERNVPAIEEESAKVKDPPAFRNKIVLFGCQRHNQIGSGELDVLKMNPDGSGLEHVLLIENAMMVHGRVSPDATRLAFSFRLKDSDDWETWILEGNGQKRKLPVGGEVVAWSPDGKSLACRLMNEKRPRTFENWVIDVDTGKKQELDLPKFDGLEDWSPKGGMLSVMAGNPDKVLNHPTKGIYPLRQIDLYALDRSKPKRITADPDFDYIWSRFSPDGKSIVHYQRRHGDDRTRVYESIAVSKLDGNKPVEVLKNSHLDADVKVVDEELPYPFHWDLDHPFWSPDGKQVVAEINTVKLTGGKVEDPRTRWALVLVNLEGKVERTIDLTKMGLIYVAHFDWR